MLDGGRWTVDRSASSTVHGLFLLFEDYNWLLGPGIRVGFDQQQGHLDGQDGMLQQVDDGHHHGLIGAMLGAEVAILFTLTRAKLSIDLVDEKILLAIAAKPDLGHLAINAYAQTKFLRHLADDSLLDRFARVHAAAREGEVVMLHTVTFDHGDLVVFDQDGDSADSHFGKINSVEK